MPTTRAVLFDMWGTLCTFRHFEAAVGANLRWMRDRFGLAADDAALFTAFSSAMQAVGHEYLSQPFYLVRDWFTEGYRRGLASVDFAATPDDLAACLDDFWEREAAGAVLRDGVPETLAALRAAGLSLGVVSISDEAELAGMIQRTGLDALVDFSLSSEAARSCKPDPGIFQEALRRAGCSAAEAVFVGDTPVIDILGANRVGMRSVLIIEPTSLGALHDLVAEGAEPQHTIHTFPELLDILQLR